MSWLLLISILHLLHNLTEVRCKCLSKWCNNNWSKWLTAGQYQCLIDSENSQNPLHCNTEDDEHPCIGSEAWWNGIWKLVENCELSTSSDFLKFPTDKAARAKREDILSGWMWCEVGQVTCYAMLGDDQWHGHSSWPVQPGPAQFPNFPQQECGLTASTLTVSWSCYTHIPLGKYLWGKIIQIFNTSKLDKYVFPAVYCWFNINI